MSFDHFKGVPIKRAWKQAPLSMLMSTWFGVGHIPGGPGTYAAIASLPAIWWLSHEMPLAWRVALFVVFTLVSFYWCDRAGDALRQSDSRHIVLDEVLGVWLALLWFDGLSFWPLAVGCTAFRLFDIKKPWPIRDIDQQLKGGVGVVVDDLVAGLYAIPFVVVTLYLI